tara:strand:- start:4385 stop:4690 length:306 start_codon:yes stop_codon:yes gene_type:complete
LVDGLLGASYSHATSDSAGNVKELPTKSAGGVTEALARIDDALDRLENAVASRPAPDGLSGETENMIRSLQEERDSLAERNQQADERLAAAIRRLEKMVGG